MLGFTLLALVGVMVGMFVAVYRWMHKPSVSDETLEALWSIVVALHETTQRLETAADRLERLLTEHANGKRPSAVGGERR